MARSHTADMKRKVVQQGPSTLMISLPIKWVKKHNIIKGAELEVTEKPGSLIISQDHSQKKEASRVFVDIKDPTSYVPRFLTMPYLAGHDEIVVSYSDKSVIDLIQKDVNLLLGFEIIKMDEHKCHIKNIAKGIEQEFDNMINRLIHILITTGAELSEYIKTKNYTDMKLLLHRENECNKISLFCRRMFNIQNYHGEKSPYALYTAVSFIESAMDEYRLIIEYITHHKPKLNDSTIQFLKDVTTMSILFRKLFSKYDHDKFLEFRKMRSDIRKKFENLCSKSKHDGYIVNRIYIIMESLHHMSYV